jgi:isopentenyl-diphosphate delta-isomerase
VQEHVIVVSEQDEELYLEEKLAAHQKGLLHRAFSIFIFRSDGKMLIHQRAFSKYHSGGLWTNACCSHPRKGETVEQAAHRRLFEELGFDCPLKELFTFTYFAELDHNLKEHEFDHVLVGTYDGPVDTYNPEEVAAIRFVDMTELLLEVKLHPERFTSWFLIALPKLLQEIF